MTRYKLLCAAMTLLAPGPLFGEIVDTQARVRTTVQELIDGLSGSVNADTVQFPDDDASFPIVASASLDTIGIDGTRASIGQGLSVLEDPARLSEPNPQEFALETACYSNAPQISYRVEGVATETRTVVFSRGELNLGPLVFSREVTSRVFISGAVIFWLQEPIALASDLSANVQFTVSRSGSEVPLFSTTLSVDADDHVEATGPVRFDRIGLDELAELGVGDATMSILQSLEDDGKLVILAIPQQEHEYSYTAAVGESIELVASIDVEIRNAPGGTGVAAVVGRPFEELAEFIEQALPDVNGSEIEKSINQATASSELGDVTTSAPWIIPRPAICGALGSATLATMMVLFVAFSLARNRRRPCRSA